MTFYSKRKSNNIPSVILLRNRIREREMREAVKREQERINKQSEPKAKIEEAV